MSCPLDNTWTLDNQTMSCYYTDWYISGDSYENYHDIYKAEAWCKKYHQNATLVTVDSEYEKNLVLGMKFGEVWMKKPSNDPVLKDWVSVYSNLDIDDFDDIENCAYLGYLSSEVDTQWCSASSGTQVICELAGHSKMRREGLKNGSFHLSDNPPPPSLWSMTIHHYSK